MEIQGNIAQYEGETAEKEKKKELTNNERK